MLSIGSVGWSLGSWLQARPWLALRRDQIVIAGAGSTAVGIALMLACAVWPRLPVGLILSSYGLAGFGMGLTVASTSLAVMTLSRPAELGRWTSSLQVCEGLGNSLVIGIAGSVYAALHTGHAWSTVFGVVYLVPTLAAGLCLLVAIRIGPVHDTPPARSAP